MIRAESRTTRAPEWIDLWPVQTEDARAPVDPT